jgi:WD40 repeat protein
MLNCGQKDVETIAFSQDDKLLASALSDYTINVWDTSSGAMLKTLLGDSHTVYAIAFSPDCRLLASASEVGSIKLWESSSGAELLLEQANDDVFDLAFSLDGKVLASVSDSSIQLWNANFGAVQMPTLEGHSEDISTAAISPDGNLCATFSYDKTIKLWDAGSGEVLGTLEERGLVEVLALSPDGRLVASSYDGTVKLRDTSSGAVLYILKETSSVKALAFSPDGRLIASGSSDKTIKLRDFTTGAVLRTLEGHTGPVVQVAFSPNSKLIASQDSGAVFKIWDASSGRVLDGLQLPRSSHQERHYAKKKSFSDDGSILHKNGKPFYTISKNSGLKIAKFVSIDCEWVFWGTERVLWLPPEYRPDFFEVWRDNVAICLASGRVVFIKFAFKD